MPRMPSMPMPPSPSAADRAGRPRRPRGVRGAAAVILLSLLAACGTPPLRDGLPPSIPTGIDRVPDAVPRVEPLREGGPNKPYEVLGRRYVPATGDVAWREIGLASWYGRKFHGRATASGEIYDMFAMTAAHPTLPIPSFVRVRNPANGREAIVRVNDRGPFVAGRVIDLSYAAARRLGLLAGVAPVELQRLTHEMIRSGAWAGGPAATLAAPAAPPADGGDPLGMLLVERGLAPPAPDPRPSP